ncbi:hypothetical protein [Hymenobacter sp. PAMC 26628]|uniref:hypothetical protein n=1 Tax=Hymenobacter sp. PAMC 26628 TaxID=1484118 RepID=UPI0007701F4B|nr:hypothetical protein [Hymenobacter sp. PAMC 26628]AMJ65848.1 hypothetical protein AXW84_10705 [Hymenobacter sp. PAMC 26628]
MELQLLHETPNLAVFFDPANQWLFVDWRGDLTLALVQDNCVAVAQYLMDARYARILNSNVGVTSMAPNVPAWLAREFLPYLRLVDVQQVAWVHSPNLRVKCYTDTVLHGSDAPSVHVFDDLESAVTWLRTTYRLPVFSVGAMAA